MAVPRRVLAEQTRGVIRSVNALTGFDIEAKDGSIGKAADFYFDDVSWTVRYLVVNTGGWLTGRQVLISPRAVLKPDWVRKTLAVDLTRRQIENSPEIASDKPVSMQHQYEMYKYYGWLPYWSGAAAPASVPPPVMTEDMTRQEKGDPHLRSSSEVVNYTIEAVDGHIGHVEDFLVDDRTWIIRYMVVDTRNWLPGRKVLTAVNWIGSIDWAKATLSVTVSKETVRNAPEYETPDSVTPEYEKELFAYYNRPGYWI